MTLFKKPVIRPASAAFSLATVIFTFCVWAAFTTVQNIYTESYSLTLGTVLLILYTYGVVYWAYLSFGFYQKLKGQLAEV